MTKEDDPDALHTAALLLKKYANSKHARTQWRKNKRIYLCVCMYVCMYEGGGRMCEKSPTMEEELTIMSVCVNVCDMMWKTGRCR